MKRWKRVAASLGLFVTSGADPARADDWQALTDELAKAGVTPQLVYDGDMAANTSGGEKRGTAYSGALQVELTLDGARLAGIAGLTAYLDGLWINGGQPSKLVGDAQGVSKIAAPGALRLYEAW